MNGTLLLPLCNSLAALVFLLIYNAPAPPSRVLGSAPRAARIGSAPAPAGRHRSAATQLQMAAGLLGATIQLLGMLPSAASAGSNALQPGDLLNSCAGLALILGPTVLLPLLRPDVFEAWRTPINFAARVASFSLPNRRGRRTLVRVCQAGPSPGVKGFWRDLFLFALGSRTLALLLGGITAPLPPLPHAVVGLISLHSLVGLQPDLCSLPLWIHPAWQRRFSRLHQAASALLLVQPYRPPGQDYRLSDCRSAMLVFQATVGVLAPALLLSRFRVLLQAGPGVLSGAADSMGRGGSAGIDLKARPARQHEPARRRLCRGAAGRLSGWLRCGMEAGEAAIDRLLAVLDGRTGAWPLRLAACFLVLNVLYTAALVVEDPLPGSKLGCPPRSLPGRLSA
ncbi:hypothetical protein ABPG75_011487 [Micractinium tetrahymenae]